MTAPSIAPADAELLRLELGQDFFRRVEIGHVDRLDRRAEQGFERLAEFGLHLQPLGGGRDGGAVEGAGQPAGKQGLGSFAEALPFFLEPVRPPSLKSAI